MAVSHLFTINLAHSRWCATCELDHRSGSMKRRHLPGVVLLLQELARRLELVEGDMIQMWKLQRM